MHLIAANKLYLCRLTPANVFVTIFCWVCFRVTRVAVTFFWRITGRHLWKRGWTVHCLDHTHSTLTSCRVPTFLSTNNLSMLCSRLHRELTAYYSVTYLLWQWRTSLAERHTVSFMCEWQNFEP